MPSSARLVSKPVLRPSTLLSMSFLAPASPGSLHKWHNAVAGAAGRGADGREGTAGAGLACSRVPPLPCGAVSSSQVAGIGLPASPMGSSTAFSIVRFSGNITFKGPSERCRSPECSEAYPSSPTTQLFWVE